MKERWPLMLLAVTRTASRCIPNLHPSRLLGYLSDNNAHPTSHAEKWISAGGGLVSVFMILLISQQVLDMHGTTLVVASMSASAVLLFAVPHGAMSQPWAVLGGHIISALIGVTVARWIESPLMASAIAVSLSIVVMHYLNCLHPPGGATALVAVLGGSAVQEMGYSYAVTPVLANAVILLTIAMIFNYPFIWRRYPQAWQEAVPTEKCMIAHSDLVYALTEIDSFIDVSEEDLLRIYGLALGHHRIPQPQGQMLPIESTL
ncbi:HPP family protein [Sedimenticola selenatireducens]|nr:HPP family protein [Sedimenticola selenatireducens]